MIERWSVQIWRYDWRPSALQFARINECAALSYKKLEEFLQGSVIVFRTRSQRKRTFEPLQSTFPCMDSRSAERMSLPA
jgi:hypothetical protein